MPTQTEPTVAQFHIDVDGSPLVEEAHAAVMEVRVEENVDLPDLCLIRVVDADLRWIDDVTFAIGKALSVEMGRDRELEPVFEGEITGIEVDPTPEGLFTLVVRAYDRSHRLHRGEQTRTYVQATDADIATQIAREAGLRPQVDATPEVYEYVLQDNQSHFDFLRDRAAAIGYHFWVEGRDLHFRQLEAPAGQAVTLAYGRELSRFRAAMTAGRQVGELLVRAWNPDRKEVIVGRANRSEARPDIGQSETGGEVAGEAFGEATAVVVDEPVRNQAEADALAQALYDALTRAFIRVEGETTGHAAVRVGGSVDLQQLGDRFSGTYHVSEVVHVVNPRSGLRTRFVAGGRGNDGLLGTVVRAMEERRDLRYGVAVAVVTNNQDPQGLGRVKVKFPWLSEEVESSWARLAMPMAGDARGLLLVPEVNDEVLVAFEHGDMGHPYVVGALWNGQDALPPEGDGAVDGSGSVVKRIFHTRAGHRIEFDDTDGGGGITIEDRNGNRIFVDATDGGGGVTVEDQAGNRIALDGGDIVLEAVNITLRANATIAIEGAAGVDVESSAIVSIEGALIQLN
jgi:phage protein D